jgi:cullin-associated NEDD8-dissociated protein 1
MSSTDINQLFQDAKDYDPDKRFMAGSDLCSELLKENVQLDLSVEKKICSTFLEMLDDQNIDVQGNAVRCIKMIASKINETQISEVVSKLGECITQGKAEFRDIYTTCLKGFIQDAPDTYCKIITDTLLPMFLRGMSSGDAQEECVDIVTDLLRRFGADLHG